MDRQITVRYFRIVPEVAGGLDFQEALANIAARPMQDREVDIGRPLEGQVLVRLERLDDDPDLRPFVCGQFTRRQMENKNPEATPDGVTPLRLSEGSGLGHEIAFAYHRGLSVLAIQSDNRALSLSRALEYLLTVDPAANYRALPVLRRDAWRRYGRGSPRKVQIAIANPVNLGVVGDGVEQDGVIGATQRLSEAYDAPSVTVSFGMGHRRGSLGGDRIRRTLERILNGEERADVRSVKVWVKPHADDSAVELVNFLEEALFDRESLELDDRDVERSYLRRRNFVRALAANRMGELNDILGDD